MRFSMALLMKRPARGMQWDVYLILSILLVLLVGTPLLGQGDAAGDRRGKEEDVSSRVVFLVLTQRSSYHGVRAAAFKNHLDAQARDTGLDAPEVVLLHEKWPQAGSWTLMPVLTPMKQLYGANSSWVVVCEEESRVHLADLLQLLQHKYNASREVFVGKGLRDRQATIIHHFAFHEDPASFLYPDTAACFAITTKLWNKLADRAAKTWNKPDFSIDMKHEFAMFAWDHGTGVPFTHEPAFCAGDAAKESRQCVTTYPNFIPDCGPPVKNSDIFFAIKTCSKFHGDRAQVVRKTWGKHAENLEFYSDVADASVPTVRVGVPNTERGHCAKTLAILRRVIDAPKSRTKPWIVVADDDTILSVSRMRRVLSCYDPGEPIALGERYAYGVQSGYGYDYITGGGSMVFSLGVVEDLVTSGRCHCPADDSPDDMTLGMCLRTLRIPVLHSPLFHQARPEDYADEYLAHQLPVSFHKHWMIDPVSTYQQWFSDSDATGHDEL